MIKLCSEYLSVRCIWLNVLVMGRTSFRMNPHPLVALMSRNSLLEAGSKSEGEVTATGLEPITTFFLNKQSTIWPNWPNDQAVFWVLVCTVHFTVVRCIWLYVLVMSSKRFRVNTHFLVAWMSGNSLLEADTKCEDEVTATELEPRTT